MAERNRGTVTRAARIVGPVAATATMAWWHGIHLMPFAIRGPYVRESLVVWSYVLAGSVAWWRRPDNRTGPLMIALGLSWAVPFLPPPVTLAAVWHSLGVGLVGLPVAFLVHLVLAFPEGRLPGKLERWVVLTTYVFAVVVPFLSVVTCDASSTSPRCNFTPNALTPFPAPELSAVFARVASIGGALSVLGVAALVGRRWRRSSPIARRMLTPVWFATAVLVVTAVDIAGRTWQVLDMADWGLRYRTAGAEWLLYVRAAAHVLVPLGVVIGLLRLRRSRLAATVLARRLQERVDHEELREALAEAVGDRSIDVAYWLPERERYVDAHGEPASLPERDEDRRATPVDRGDRHLGVLVHDRLLEPELVEDVTAVAGLALENERLTAEVRAQLVELRRAQGRIVEAGDLARQRLERDLHDGAQQRLVTLGMSLREAALRLGAEDPQVRGTLETLSDDLGAALQELREFARGIHPAILTTSGLGPALRDRVRHAGVPVDLVEVPDGRFPPAIESTAYLVVVEALTNAAKHASASLVEVRVSESDGVLEARVEDDGVGGARIGPSSGLEGLADRVGALGGTFTVGERAGGGTSVVATLPVALPMGPD